MQKNKILIVSECFYPEEFKINDLALYWISQGFSVDVLTLNPSYPKGKIYHGYKNSFFSKDEYKGINIYKVRAITGYNSSLIKKLLKYINFMFLGSIVGLFIGKKYDYIFGFNTGALTSMLPAYIIKKIYKKPLMFWIQDIWPKSVYAYGFKKHKLLVYFLDWFCNKIYNSIDSIAISSKSFKNELKPYIKSNISYNYCPNWPDDFNNSDIKYDFNKYHDQTNQKIHFTFAGNIGKVQNLENIIKAFCLLDKKSLDKSQLNIIGDGSNLQDLKNMPQSKNKNIIFHGYKNRDDMSKYLNGSDFLIVSLISKDIFSHTVPAKTQTYISVKKPIFAIINGETRSIIENNNLGIYANPSNINDIKEKFEFCLNLDEKSKNEFSLNNDDLLNKVFNKDIIMSKLTNILRNSN